MAIDAQSGRPARRGGRRRRWLVLTAALVVAAAAGAYLLLRSRSAPAAATAPVTTTVTKAPYQVTVSGPGTLSPARSVVLGPSVSGRLMSIASVGDRVKQGAVLAQVDDSSFRRAAENARLSLDKAQASLAALQAGQAKAEATTASQIASAQTALDSAQRALDQQTHTAALTHTLYDMGSASATELQSAEDALTAAREAVASARSDLATLRQNQQLQHDADSQDLANATVSVEQAKLTLASAQQDLASTSVLAPFDGVVSATTSAVGEQVGSGSGLLTFVDDATLELDAQIDESDIAQVAAGQGASVTLDAAGQRTIPGEVVRIAPTATLVSNIPIFYVTVRVDNRERNLRAGMTGQATVVVHEIADTFQLPARAVHSNNDRSYVLVQQSTGGYRPAPVTVVGTAGINSVLTGDLTDGAVVLVSDGGGAAAGQPAGTTDRGQGGGSRPPGAVPFVNPGGNFRRPRGAAGSAARRP